MDIETVLSQIASGKFDDSLDKITQAAKDRLSEVRKSKKITDFSVGDRVRFNELTGTRYMVGQYAQIISKNRTKVVVRLETPVGRFARYLPNGESQSSNVTVPLSIIDPA